MRMTPVPDINNQTIDIQKTLCIELLEEYAPVSEELVARIHAEGDLSILKTWLQYAAKSTSLEEFLEKMNGI